MVIEISSSEDDGHGATPGPRPVKCARTHSNESRTYSPSRNGPLKRRAIRNLIESSSESEDEAVQNEPPADVIDLTLDESDDGRATPVKDKARSSAPLAVVPRYQSLYSDSEDSDGDVFEDAIDDSILTL